MASALLAVGGIGIGFSLVPGAVSPAYRTVREGLDVATVDRLTTR
jgi:hypothetical protein